METIEYENLGKLNSPFFEEYKLAFERTLRSGWYVLGSEVSEFEKEYAAYCQSKYCIGVASGLDALILAIEVLDLPPQSEIIVPSNTYIATVLAILKSGHVPVLTEPDLDTYNISINGIKSVFSTKTKAIIAVHLYGKLCPMREIMNFANNNGIFVIEDAAQSHGATHFEIKSGNWGHLAAHSFYPTKNLGALGDGGAITTNSEKWFEKLLYLRNYGSKKKYYNEYIGSNSRLDEIQASFLRVKLKYLDKINLHKRMLARLYNDLLPENVVKPSTSKDGEDVFHIYPIRCNKREMLKSYLLSQSIKTEIHYPIPPHKQNAYRKLFHEKSFPISELIHDQILSLPISLFHTKEDIQRVSAAINTFFD